METKHNSSEDSVLIPKINPSIRESVIPENHGTQGLSGKKKHTFWGKPMFKVVLIVAVVFLTISVAFGVIAYGFYKKALNLTDNIASLKAAITQNDLDLLKSEMSKTKEEIANLNSSYAPIRAFSFIPFFGDYIKDGEHGLVAASAGLEAGITVVDTVSPYADILGFKKGSEQAGSGVETAQDRIDFVIKTLPELAPKADDLSKKVSRVSDELSNIDPERYPETLFDKPLRSKIKEVIELSELASEYVSKSKPLLEVSPYILGAESPRTYMVIFQNDKELRATGGFITAYSIAKVEKGKFEPVSSSDIYSLDDSYKPSIEAPDPVVKYLKGPYKVSPNLRLRDMNWSPDFAASMNLFGEEIKKAGIKNIDGIIAVDTQLLVNLLNAIGPIGVSGFGNFSTEITPKCNCPQVIYELESFADVEGPVVWSQDEPGKIIFAPENYDNRKKIIGPLMNSILANALGQPKDKIPGLFESVIKSLNEKHVLFYFFDEKAQNAVDKFGIAGTLNETEGDYFHVNDSNLGGRKSNLYVTQEVSQEVAVGKSGKIEKTVSITYKNQAPYDGWLNSVLPNWVRIYVPKGSTLTEFSGIDGDAEVYEDEGKTVFAGGFELRPLGVVKLTLKYTLPFGSEGEYKVFVQKQPGTDAHRYSFLVKGKEEEILLNQDRQLKFKI